MADGQTAAERWGDQPWRRKAREEGCWCADVRKPCTRHDGWDDGYEAGVAAEREACADVVWDAAHAGDVTPEVVDAATRIMAAIRNRGEAADV